MAAVVAAAPGLDAAGPGDVAAAAGPGPDLPDNVAAPAGLHTTGPDVPADPSNKNGGGLFNKRQAIFVVAMVSVAILLAVAIYLGEDRAYTRYSWGHPRLPKTRREFT